MDDVILVLVEAYLVFKNVADKNKKKVLFWFFLYWITFQNIERICITHYENPQKKIQIMQTALFGAFSWLGQKVHK